MSNDKFLMVSLDDEKSKEIAEVLSSKTCKKIISHLAEAGEASQKDLSSALRIPMNTTEYNVKKLLSSGFIQRRKNFFWSKKGKKIVMYELSNKSIVISSKKTNAQKMKSIVPGFMMVLAGSFAVWAYERIATLRDFSNDAVQKSAEILVSPEAAVASSQEVFPITSGNYDLGMLFSMPAWAWFLLGGMVVLFVLSIVNWRKL